MRALSAGLAAFLRRGPSLAPARGFRSVALGVLAGVLLAPQAGAERAPASPSAGGRDTEFWIEQHDADGLVRLHWRSPQASGAVLADLATVGDARGVACDLAGVPPREQARHTAVVLYRCGDPRLVDLALAAPEGSWGSDLTVSGPDGIPVTFTAGDSEHAFGMRP